MHVNGRRQDIDEIMARMEAVRGRLNHDAKAAKQSVQEMTDWRNVVRKNPLACAAAAAVAGFLLVPQKPKPQGLTAKDIERLAKDHKVIVARESPSKPGFLGAIAAIAGAALTRTATSYVTNKVADLTRLNEREVS